MMNSIQKVRPKTLIMLLTLIVCVTSAPLSQVLADNRGRGPQGGHEDRDWRGHEAGAHRYWRGGYRDPSVVYAPPVVYEPPAPYESPGLNLIVPLHIH